MYTWRTDWRRSSMNWVALSLSLLYALSSHGAQSGSLKCLTEILSNYSWGRYSQESIACATQQNLFTEGMKALCEGNSTSKEYRVYRGVELKHDELNKKFLAAAEDEKPAALLNLRAITMEWLVAYKSEMQLALFQIKVPLDECARSSLASNTSSGH